MSLDKKMLEKILGRQQHYDLFNYRVTVRQFYENKRVLVTGANGSIGHEIGPYLQNHAGDVLLTDIEGDFDHLDVRSLYQVEDTFHAFKPDLIIHLAAGKHAPVGEIEPEETVRTNIDGTENLIRASKGLKNIPAISLASTCKACDPETVYGATKMICERMVLNAGGTVARFFNVVETQGNVFEIWDNVPEGEAIEVVNDCQRYFISLEEAATLMLIASVLHPDRYGIKAEQRSMKDIAAVYKPNSKKKAVKPRRGDRLVEPYLASNEWDVDCPLPGMRMIRNSHDPSANKS